MKKEVLNLDDLNVNQLPELATFEATQKELVEKNPFVEIIDNKTYEQAKVHRTALLKGRTALENQEKLIASKLSNFRKSVGEKTKQLIEITLPFEEKQQSEVKRWEAIKEAEKQEKERLEQERIDNIKSKINEIETECYSVIQKITFESIMNTTQEVTNLLETDFDFEEYDVMFEQMKTRVSNDFMSKVNDLTQREKERKEREELQKELFQVRVTRLKELGFTLVNSFFVPDYSTIEISELTILEMASSDFEQYLSNIKVAKEELENAKRDAEIKQQKDEQFEVRKNRLAEIGVFQSNNWFENEFKDTMVNYELVYDASVLQFEDYLKEAKEAIKLGVDLRYQQELAEQEKRKQEAIAQKKADAENKARVKRLATDKKIIAESFETYFADLHLETENQETKDFIERANFKIAMVKSELLTELKNL